MSEQMVSEKTRIKPGKVVRRNLTMQLKINYQVPIKLKSVIPHHMAKFQGNKVKPQTVNCKLLRFKYNKKYF